MAFSVSARTAAEDARTTDVGPVRIPGQPGRLARYEGLLVGSAAVLVFVAVWQLAAFRRLVPELFLPGPMDIANAFGAYIAKGQIWPDMWISGQELMYGFALSIVVGLPVGMLMGWYRRLNEALDPFVTFFYSIPRVALTPLLIVWFGIGINSKIAVVFLGAIFAIVINTAAGVRNLDPALIVRRQRRAAVSHDSSARVSSFHSDRTSARSGSRVDGCGGGRAGSGAGRRRHDDGYRRCDIPDVEGVRRPGHLRRLGAGDDQHPVAHRTAVPELETQPHVNRQKEGVLTP